MSLGAPVPQCCQGAAADQGQNQAEGLGREHPDLSEEPGCPAGMVEVPGLNSVPVGKKTQCPYGYNVSLASYSVLIKYTYLKLHFFLLLNSIIHVTQSEAFLPLTRLNTKKYKIKLWKNTTTTHSRSLERLFLLFLFLLLLFFLLLLVLVLLRPCASCSGRELGALTLLGHQAAVVLVARVIPCGLSRGEVEIVDIPRHILAAGEEGGEEGGHFGTSKKAQKSEGEMMGGWVGERRDVTRGNVTETERCTK